MIFHILGRTINNKFREELAKISQVTLAAYKCKILELEVATHTVTSIDKNKKHLAAPLKTKNNKKHNQNQKKSMNFKNAPYSLCGCCYKCGNSHQAKDCKCTKLQCQHCGKPGHLQKVCFQHLNMTVSYRSRECCTSEY